MTPRGIRLAGRLAFAVGVVGLASCRSLTAPALLPIAGIARLDEACPADHGTTFAVAEDHSDQPAGCPPLECGPCVCPPPPPVPVVAPCLVCDGGDHAAIAKPVGRFGIGNLTAGDTVARFRPADGLSAGYDAIGNGEVCLTTSNCACVFAPRFASVRELIRPHEDAAPLGPKGLALDTLAEAAVDTLPVLDRRQALLPAGARRAELGLAVEERLPPLAVDQNAVPGESLNLENPAEKTLDVELLATGRVDAPQMAVGFDVPLAWTCVQAAQVTVKGESADLVAADRGTATLRLEQPGRCELTLCKQAGSDTARSGEELDFTIYMMNSGDRPLEDVVLADAIPQRLILIPGSAVSNLPAEIGTDTGDDGSVVIRWRLEQVLRPGEGGFVRFRTRVR